MSLSLEEDHQKLNFQVSTHLSPSSCWFILHHHPSLTFQVFRGAFPLGREGRELQRNFYPKWPWQKFQYQAVLHSIDKYPGMPTKPWIGAGSLGTGSGDLAIKRSFCSVFFRTKWFKNHLFLKLKFRLSFFPVLFQHNISKTKNPTSINHSIIQSFTTQNGTTRSFCAKLGPQTKLQVIPTGQSSSTWHGNPWSTDNQSSSCTTSGFW